MADLTREQLDTIGGRHAPDGQDEGAICHTCVHYEPGAHDPTPDDWPCDAASLLEALRRSQLDVMVARAQAAALAHHLRNAIHDLIGDWNESGGPTMDYRAADEALGDFGLPPDVAQAIRDEADASDRRQAVLETRHLR